MPIYEYCCPECDHVFEEWQKDFEDREAECPKCGGAGKRMISSTSFVLKGSGWYVTDYAGKKPANGNGNGDGKPQEEKKAETASDAPKDSKKADTPAPAKKADSKASASDKS